MSILTIFKRVKEEQATVTTATIDELIDVMAGGGDLSSEQQNDLVRLAAEAGIPAAVIERECAWRGRMRKLDQQLEKLLDVESRHSAARHEAVEFATATENLIAPRRAEQTRLDDVVADIRKQLDQLYTVRRERQTGESQTSPLLQHKLRQSPHPRRSDAEALAEAERFARWQSDASMSLPERKAREAARKNPQRQVVRRPEGREDRPLPDADRVRSGAPIGGPTLAHLEG